MNVIALILWIVAAALFAVAALAPPYSGRLTNAGLALLTVALIVQFAAKSHTVTF